MIAAGGRPRNKNLVPELRRLGHPVEVFEALDPRSAASSIGIPDLERTAIRSLLGRPMTLGEIGCAASHLHCQSDLSEPAREWRLVMEDDAALEPTFALVCEILNRLRSDQPRVLTLLSNPKIPVRRGSAFHIEGTYGGSGVKVAQYYRPPHRTIAYGINLAARQTASAHPLISGVADWPPWAAQFEFWTAFPWLVRDIGETSLIDPTGEERSPLMVRRRRIRWRLDMKFDYLLQEQSSTWRRELGGWNPYLLHIVSPRLTELIRRPLQTGLDGTSESPRMR